MTQAIRTPSLEGADSTVATHYLVSMSQPGSHLFEVRFQISRHYGAGPVVDSGVIDLKMPVWTPGSYMVREYARHLQDFQVCDRHDQSLSWSKVSKNTWRVQAGESDSLIVHYRIYANELTVRTNHLDSTHGYFNGAALFFYVPGWENLPIQVAIAPPKGWWVTTSLPSVSGVENTFEATDFDTLVDSPFEIGTHQVYDFEAAGKPHQLAIWGQGNGDVDRLITDCRKIIHEVSNLFSGLPYDRYVFLLHLSSQGYGGLEHKNSCSLNYPRLGLRDRDKYNRFMQLVAHEFFHLWNVKRLRPKELEVFNYESECYTTSLWFCEGATSYYDGWMIYRSGIVEVKDFLNGLSKDISRFLTTPGRFVQPLGESSWDAWIKLYRRDAYSDNNQMSYYLKGELVSFMLELLIRNRHGNRRSLDDVMVLMWEKFGKSEKGYTATELQSAIASVAEMDLDDFFNRYLHGTEELPLNDYLQPFGLVIKPQNNDIVPDLGWRLAAENGKTIVKFVEAGSPAQLAGIDAEDELLAINGFRVSVENISDRLLDFKPGDEVHISFFHQDELRTSEAILRSPRPSAYKITSVEEPTPEQQRNFEGWLGCPYHQLYSTRQNI
ncbi:MAG: M61 family metallopeptidase [Limnospira sp. PMC 1291.21]|uniref:Peptidase M61 (Metalloprotease (''zincins''), catalytic domain) n=5 Tax=Oscillatoriales TaxID=1150 RepID=A0A9P1NZ88_9CYAN|nr:MULTISPECIES: M61 family metallopeptidase [Limnospira]EKD06408.1 putative peptidase M61 [Arthrospira platensis C1]MDC0839237.1 M61 family metallopeptidase [Limnoraphis robusta]MDY7051987.1 M61 family metallopeptidase [Limnospira fusiformis LS22]QJB26903.1 M61 family metallopeptidase [Limnospira fusiformis SAG 85.79]SMZ64507.1 peptidase M61 [Arthrospira sp. SRM16]